MKFSISLPTGFEGVMYPIPFVDPADFVRLLQIAGEGALTIPVTRTFSLHDLHEGLELLGSGHARGKYVVTLEG